LKGFCADFLRDPFSITTFNSSQPSPDCNMNNLVFVPPLDSYFSLWDICMMEPTSSPMRSSELEE
jgi:hypothetical protein